MELYIVRHGETIWNRKRLLQGQTDIDLTSEGREVAGRLGEKLEDTRIDMIFASPLNRAFETACLIRGHRNIEIKKDNRLKEISFGVAEGIDYKTWDDIDSPYNSFFTNPGEYNPPEKGERFEQVIDRTRDFIKNEIEPLADCCERVMIVAHGALNKGIMCYLEGHGTDKYWGDGLQKNCEATVFSYDGNKWTLISEKDGAGNS